MNFISDEFLLKKKIIETGQPFTVNIFRKCDPVIVTDAEVVCHVNEYHSWFCICFDIEGGSLVCVKDVKTPLYQLISQ